MEKQYCTAIVLAAGSGKRMGTKVHKQYLLMGGKPVLYYSLKAFEDSELIDEIILVAGRGEEEYCSEQIVEKYKISKVKKSSPEARSGMTPSGTDFRRRKKMGLFSSTTARGHS